MFEFANWKQGAYIITVAVLGLAAFFYGLFSSLKKAGRFKGTK